MRVDAFDYDLPEGLIALRPLKNREEARLLCVQGPRLANRHIGDLPQLLEAGDLVVVNNTKVIPAYLKVMRAPRPIGGNTEPVTIDLTLLRRCEATLWDALARPAKRLQTGDRLSASPEVDLVVEEKLDEGKVQLRFDCAPEDVGTLLSQKGKMPLPPYIASRRPIDVDDIQDYQTVFAKMEGAVAAPTAGLHVTAALLAQLKSRGVGIAEVTLHVGPATFLPVKVDDTDAHVMHAEWGEVSVGVATQINKTHQKGGRVMAVGTTTLRLLETAARDDGSVEPFCGKTSIFIVPGYRFKTADLLLTNFHLPRSTLFMMVSAFSGLESIKLAYRHAIAEKYRFYSYGDACLLERSNHSTP